MTWRQTTKLHSIHFYFSFWFFDPLSDIVPRGSLPEHADTSIMFCYIQPKATSLSHTITTNKEIMAKNSDQITNSEADVSSINSFMATRCMKTKISLVHVGIGVDICIEMIPSLQTREVLCTLRSQGASLVSLTLISSEVKTSRQEYKVGARHWSVDDVLIFFKNCWKKRKKQNSQSNARRILQ